MAVRIIKSKSDDEIDTGFNFDLDTDFNKIMEKGLTPLRGKIYKAFGRKMGKAIIEGAGLTGEEYMKTPEGKKYQKECIKSWEKYVKQDAMEILFEEASMSHWSHNMANNSISYHIEVTESQPGIVLRHARIGINKYAIGDTSNWKSRQSKRKYHGAYTTIWEYKGFRMKPGEDYSNIADEKMPYTKGFISKAKRRILS